MSTEHYERVAAAVAAVREMMPVHLVVGRLHITEEVHAACTASFKAAEAWLENPTDEATYAAYLSADKVEDILDQIQEDGWDSDPAIYATAAVARATDEVEGRWLPDHVTAAVRSLYKA